VSVSFTIDEGLGYAFMRVFFNFSLGDSDLTLIPFITAQVITEYSMFLNPNLPIYDST